VPARSAYEYAIVRVVPRVEREEFVNAGAIVFCVERGFLAARVELGREKILALAPDADLALIEEHLRAIPAIAAGGEGSGPIGKLSPRERFRWLVAPRSTVVQTSPVHAGLCEEPERALEDLLERMVRRPPPGGGPAPA
jgi:hypothetical protein